MEYKCSDCPRNCAALRGEENDHGVCISPALPKVARAAAHYGEEPCISGERGSGAVFFSGCNLRCVYCQNREISRASVGKTLNAGQLRTLFLKLRDQGVHNINLVTPSHFIREIAKALDGLELGIPVIWNSSAFDKVDMLKMLEGLIQVYMPDLKYLDRYPAAKYSGAQEYPIVAKAAIQEMYRQTGPYRLDDGGIMQSGVLIRHLILPGQERNSRAVIDYVAESFPHGSVMFSLMSQYTPMPWLRMYPELQQRVPAQVCEELRDYMISKGIEDGYWQEPSSADEEFIPAFDLTGLEDF